MEYSILFVDDDRQIIKAIKREFSDTAYTIYYADSGREALNILSENKIDIIITDVMMPEMNGYELLKEAKNLNPNIIRLVLSGYSDEKLTFKIINTSLAKAFIYKPWNENELINKVEEIIKIDKSLNNKAFKEILNYPNKLPTIPQLYFQLTNIIDDDNADVDKVINLISKDQVTTARILKVVNSAFYGTKTGSIKTAVLNLGFVRVKNIIATLEVFNFGNNKYGKVLWDHSNITNMLTIRLYETILKKKIPEMLSTVGLLHDIGKAVFLKVYYERYVNILKFKEADESLNISELEKKEFGLTHEELGSAILNYWEFPSQVIEIALEHHMFEKDIHVDKEIVCIVHLADFYSWRLIDLDFSSPINEKVFTYLNVSREEIEKIVDSIINDVKNKAFL